MTVLTERPHHPYSPSKLQYLEACPCFKEKSETNARAVAGTLAHRSVETGEDDAQISDEDASAVAECLDFVEKRRKVLQDESELTLGPGAREIRELKEPYLPIDDCVFDDCQATTAGYVDYILMSWDEVYADIIDWKFGFWAVESADNNLQGIAYALGVFKKFPKVQEVRFWFRQPRISFYTDAVFTREQIPALYLRVQAVVARARIARRAGDFKDAKPFTPVCNFCGALGSCPVGLAFALGIAKKFHPVEWPEDITPTKVMDPRNTKLALNLAAIVKTWAEAFRRQVTDRVLRGDAPIPEGMRVQTNEGRRSIKDMALFKEISLKYVDPQSYESALDASFGPIEEALTTAAPRGTKKATLEAYQNELMERGAVERGASFSFLKMSNGEGEQKQQSST
jgi:hypothetical protein